MVDAGLAAGSSNQTDPHVANGGDSTQVPAEGGSLQPPQAQNTQVNYPLAVRREGAGYVNGPMSAHVRQELRQRRQQQRRQQIDW